MSKFPLNPRDNLQTLLMLLIFGEFIVVCFLATFSEPVKEVFGKPVIPINLEDSDISYAGRVILLYHALAIPFVCAIALLFIEMFETRPLLAIQAKWTIFSGSVCVMIGGISFAYIFQDMVSHAIFLVGLSLVFFGGLLFILSILPTKNFPTTREKNLTFFGFDAEYFNLFLVMAYFWISAAIGGIVGALSSGDEAFLAEDIVRDDTHNLVQRMVISHLHIMVALLVTGVFMMIIHYTEISDRFYKWVMIAIIPGSFLISLGAWLVIFKFEPAHKLINVGAMILIFAGFIVAHQGFTSIAKDVEGSKLVKLKYMIKEEPVRFTLYFQLIWGNFVSTIPGIYVAINLDKFRSDRYIDVERSFNVGHWHILASLIGITTVLLLIEVYSIEKPFSKLTGWLFLSGSIIGYGGGAAYMIRSPDSSGTVSFIFMNVGNMMLFFGVGIFVFGFLKTFRSQNSDLSEPDTMMK